MVEAAGCAGLDTRSSWLAAARRSSRGRRSWCARRWLPRPARSCRDTEQQREPEHRPPAAAQFGPQVSRSAPITRSAARSRRHPGRGPAGPDSDQVGQHHSGRDSQRTSAPARWPGRPPRRTGEHRPGPASGQQAQRSAGEQRSRGQRGRLPAHHAQQPGPDRPRDLSRARSRLRRRTGQQGMAERADGQRAEERNRGRAGCRGRPCSVDVAGAVVGGDQERPLGQPARVFAASRRRAAAGRSVPGL